jgi:hypothetical protein
LPGLWRDYIINTVLPEQDTYRTQKQPPLHLPLRVKKQQPGTRTTDVGMLDERSAGQEKKNQKRREEVEG